MVQLATETKRKVSEIIENFPAEINGLKTIENLNVLPLGSDDVLIGIDWLEHHRVVLYCYNKTFTCLDDKGDDRKVQDIFRAVSVR